MLNKTRKEIKKEISELQFAINPTEEKGICWRWTNHGLDMLGIYIEHKISQAKKEERERIIKMIEDNRPHHEYCDAYKSDLIGKHNDEIAQDKFALKLLKLLSDLSQKEETRKDKE